MCFFLILLILCACRNICSCQKVLCACNRTRLFLLDVAFNSVNYQMFSAVYGEMYLLVQNLMLFKPLAWGIRFYCFPYLCRQTKKTSSDLYLLQYFGPMAESMESKYKSLKKSISNTALMPKKYFQEC